MPPEGLSSSARRLSRATTTAIAGIVHALKPSRWAKGVLGLDLDPWQVEICDLGAGTQGLALCHRQSGKSWAGALVIAH